ncbi:MAG: sigma-70 region 4 domain-containing protein [Bacillota bacterium]|nr:MAG: sigma-70 region 4 domain-containing protein [Bacillota bacterium]
MASFRMSTYLSQRALPLSNVNPLSLLASHNDIKTFGQITDAMLDEVYCSFDKTINRQLFWRLIRQLAFYGVVFEGKLQRHNVIHDFEGQMYIWISHKYRDEHILNTTRESQQARFELGVMTYGDIVGIPYASLRAMGQSELVFHFLSFEGFSNVSLAQFSEGEAEEPVSRIIRVADTQLTISPETMHAPIKLEDLPGCQNVIRHLHKRGYQNWGQLPADLDSLLYSFGGVGPKVVAKFAKNLDTYMNQNKTAIMRGGAYEGMAIPEALMRLPLHADLFPDTNIVLVRLHSEGKYTWADLPLQDLTSYLHAIKGVGVRHVSKFVSRLKEWTNLFAGVESLSGLLFLEGSFARVSTQYLSIPLRYFFPESLCGDGLDSVLIASPDTSADQLPVTLSDLRIQNVSQRTIRSLFDFLSKLSKHQEITENFASLVAECESLVNTPVDYNEDSYAYILKLRAGLSSQGQKSTFQNMAEHLGVTRAWACQLYNKALAELACRHALVCGLLAYDLHKTRFELLSYLNLVDIQLGGCVLLVSEILELYGVYVDPDTGIATSLTQHGTDQLLSDFRDYLEEHCQDCILTVQGLQAEASAFVDLRRLGSAAIPVLIGLAEKHVLFRLTNGEMVIAGSKTKLALKVFRETIADANGVALYKNFQAIKHRLDVVAPDAFPNEHAYVSALLRNPDILLWGWGVYTTRDRITASPDDIAPIAEWIITQFRKGVPQLSSRAAYLEFRESLYSAGVTNEHALYSCLRLFYSDRFFLPKCPRVYPITQSSIQSYGEILSAHLDRHGPLPLVTLQEEFLHVRGWKDSQLTQTLSRTPRIIRVDKGVYGLIDEYQHLEPKVLDLSVALMSKLKATGDDISIRALFSEKKATCLRLGIHNEYLLYGLMSDFCNDRFTFRRFPHVGLVGGEADAGQSHRGILNRYLASLGTSVFKEQLTREFVQKRGWTAVALDNALAQNDVLLLERGATPEYVHRAVVDWTDEKEVALEDWVVDVLGELRSRETPLGLVRRDILTTEKLPPLSGGIPWTEDILKCFLSDLDFILLLGVRQSVIIDYPNILGIEDDEGVIAYILNKYFGGAAKKTLLDKKLDELDFRPRRSHLGQGLVYEQGDEILVTTLRGE